MHGAARLPVWRSIGAIYRFILNHPRELARIGWLPFLLLVALSLFLGSFEPSPDAPVTLADAGPAIVQLLAGGLAQGCIAVFVLVAWHRVVMRALAAEAVTSDRSPRPPGHRELVYFIQMLGLSLLFLAILLGVALGVAVFLHLGFWLAAPGAAPAAKNAAFAIIGYVAMLIGLVPAFYIALRLSLALPETAVTARAGRFAQSWRASAGCGWRMVAITVLAMLPVEALNLGLALAAEAAFGTPAHYPLVVAACAGLVLLMAVLGSALSKCYLALRDAVPDIAAGQLAGAEAQ